MMDVLKVSEGQPEQRVVDADYAGDDAAPGTVAALWQRIEGYIAHRWQPRPVTWVLCGSGDWTPPLTPATIDTIEYWSGGDWHTVVQNPTPLGYEFDAGTYRITATVGEDSDPPAAVLEAFNRLAGYLEDEITLVNSATRETVNYGNGLSVSRDRPAAWVAQALQHSGAADLLRPYRRA